MYPGRPCRYKATDGCSIHEQRPTDPCKAYECLWLKSEDMPLWMKPDQIDVIFSDRMTPYGEPYWVVTEAGSRLDSLVLSWIIDQYFASNRTLNVLYQVGGVWLYFGSPTFAQFVQSQKLGF